MKYYLKKNWKISSIVCIFQIGVWGMQAAVQLLLMQSFDAAIHLDFQAFLFWTAMNLIGWGVYFLLGILQGYFQTQAVRRLNNHVRHDMYFTLLQKSYREYQAQDTGEYLSWLTNDLRQIEKLAWNPFFNCVGRVAQIFWSMLALAMLHWSLLAASLVTAAIMLAIPKLFEGKMERLGTENSDAQAKGVSLLKDLVSGFEVLRFFGHKDLFLRKGDSVSDEMEEPNCRMNYTQNTFSGIIGFVNVSLQILSDILIVILAFNNIIKLAVLSGGGNLIGGVANGLQNGANLRLSIAASKPYFGKIRGCMVEREDTQKCVHAQGDISVENLSFCYGERQIFSGLEMCFSKGGKYAIIGSSGCGKSTLLKILLGWLPDYTGAIRFGGIDAREYTLEQLQREMGYIEQNVFLFNTTIQFNITLGEECSHEQMRKILKDSALEEDIFAMPKGLDTVVGEGGCNLSGGQKQRVAIARALFHNCSVLLVDEGTSALDQENADIVEKKLLSNPTLTLILVSHHLSPERKAQFDKVFSL